MKNYIPFILIALLVSCSGPVLLTQSGNSASSEFRNGNYASVFPVLKNHIYSLESRGKAVPDSIYFQAGYSALMLDSLQFARQYLEKIAYIDQADPKAQWALAQVYRKIDNLSMEIRILEQLIKGHPQDELIAQYKSRYFETLVESENFEKALLLWPDIEALSNDNLELTEKYLILDEGMGFENNGKDKALDLLKADEQNSVALSYLANFYYSKAEERYKKEMAAYEQNKTNSQYKRLLKELKLASTDFRKARDYYLKLYKIRPNPKTAGRLYRVYTYLSNKSKAAYYKKLAGE